VKDGHRRVCGPPSGGTVACDLNLKVKFQPDFDKFLREVEHAHVRWMARRTAQTAIKENKERLKDMHQEMLRTGLLENDPIELTAGLHYRMSHGMWHVHFSLLRGWRRYVPDQK
jgi:hypothetical protein